MAMCTWHVTSTCFLVNFQYKLPRMEGLHRKMVFSAISVLMLNLFLKKSHQSIDTYRQKYDISGTLCKKTAPTGLFTMPVIIITYNLMVIIVKATSRPTDCWLRNSYTEAHIGLLTVPLLLSLLKRKQKKLEKNVDLVSWENIVFGQLSSPYIFCR